MADTYVIGDDGEGLGFPAGTEFIPITDGMINGQVATVRATNGDEYQFNINEVPLLYPDGQGGYGVASAEQIGAESTFNAIRQTNQQSPGALALPNKMGIVYPEDIPNVRIAVDPATGQPIGSTAGTPATTIPPGDTYSGGGYTGGGGGGGGGGGYASTSSSSSSGGWNGPTVMYANGWVPPMFGGDYTYQQWLDMTRPADDGSSGPAALPSLPWKNSSPMMDPFNGNPPGNPFASGWYSGGYGGYSGYGAQQSAAADPSQLPLAKRLYQKYSGLRQQVTPGAPPTQSEYDKAQRQQQVDYRKNERDYQNYQAALNMRSNPITGLRDYLGSQSRYEGPEYDLYNSMPLTGLQYLLNSKAKAKQFDDPKRYQKQLQQMYRQIDQSSQGWNYDQLMKGVWGGGKNSAVSSLFQQRGTPEARYDSNGMYTGMTKGKSTGADPTSQTYAMNNLLNSVYRTTMDPATAATWSAYADRQMGRWVNRQYQRNPNNYGDIRKYMRGRVL